MKAYDKEHDEIEALEIESRLQKIRDAWPDSCEMGQIHRIQSKSDVAIWNVPWGKVLPRLRGLNKAMKSILAREPSMSMFRKLRDAKDRIMIREFLSD